MISDIEYGRNKDIIDFSRLRAEIDKFEYITNKKAYLIMSAATIDYVSNSYYLQFSASERKGRMAVELFGHKVLEDNDLGFGEIDVR